MCVAFVVMRSAADISEVVSWVIWPVRSCEAVPSVMVWFSVEVVGEGRRQKEVIAALCNKELEIIFLE